MTEFYFWVNFEFALMIGIPHMISIDCPICESVID